jgi:hypothetical protein
MDRDEEVQMATRLFAYTCGAIGAGCNEELRERLLYEVRDGPHRLTELADEGLFLWSSAVTDAGTQLHLYLNCGDVAKLLLQVDARNLGVSDETIAEWGRMAAEDGNVYVTVPDTPDEDLQDPNTNEGDDKE